MLVGVINGKINFEGNIFNGTCIFSNCWCVGIEGYSSICSCNDGHIRNPFTYICGLVFEALHFMSSLCGMLLDIRVDFFFYSDYAVKIAQSILTKSIAWLCYEWLFSTCQWYILYIYLSKIICLFALFLTIVSINKFNYFLALKWLDANDTMQWVAIYIWK